MSSRPKQSVTVVERWKQTSGGMLRGWDTLASADGLSVRAAWKFFEDDLLLHRDCSRTTVSRDGKRGPIRRIDHTDRQGARRPCVECAIHRDGKCPICGKDLSGARSLKIRARVHLRKEHPEHA